MTSLLTNSMALATSLAAVGVLAVGTTSALFSATQSKAADTFAAGTVSVGLSSTPSVACNVTAMMPGDSSAGFGSGSGSLVACSYNVKYTGSAGAWLAVDVAVGTGTPNLFNGAATGLQFKISINGATSTPILDGTTYKTIGGTATAVVAGTPVANLLINPTAALATSPSPAALGDEFTIDVVYALPLTAPNALQGGSATLGLTFHAAQSANNPIGSCVTFRQCSTVTWG